MLEKVICPNCGNKTPNAAKCMFCGDPLRRDDKPDPTISASGENAVFAKARSFENLRSRLVLADVRFYQYLADGTMPGIKKVRVPDGSQAVVVSQIGTDLLGPGEHEVGTRGVASSLREALRSDREGGTLCVCLFPSGGVSLALTLPDAQDIEEVDGNVNQAVERLSLRTADNLLGVVEMTARLRVAQPLKLVTLYARELLRKAMTDQPIAPKGLIGTAAFPLKALGRFLFGGKGESVASEPERITLHQIYRSFRAELALAVRTAVRQETAEALYDTIQVRDRISSDLAQTLSTTLDGFGLALDRVTTFKFQCEDYDQLLKERGGLALQKEALRDKRQAAEIDAEEKVILRDRRQTEAEDNRHATSTVADLDRHVLDEKAKTDEVSDRFAAEQQKRQLAMDAQARSHGREQDLQDGQQKLQLRHEELKMKLELMNMAADAQQRRQLALEEARVNNHQRLLDAQATNEQRLLDARAENQQRLLAASAGMSGEQILAAALSMNPSLATAYAEGQKAKHILNNYDKQVEMQNEFRQQLQNSYGDNSKLVHGLLNEAVKQWGHVQGEKAGASRAQVVATGTGQHLVQVHQLPPGGEGGASGGPKE